MSTSIEIDGVNLIPVKDATDLVSYSKDYISRLAREGKVVASQVGRQWFVDAVSLKNFAESASLEEEARKVELSAERKRELQAKEKVDNLESFASSLTRRHRLEALGVSIATLCLGLVVGVSAYTSSLFSYPNSSQVADSVALVLSPLTSPHEEDMVIDSVPTTSSIPVASEFPNEIPPYTSVEKYPVFETVTETRVLNENASGILVFAKGGEVKDAKAVEALFSDEVKVDFADNNSGTIYFEQEGGQVAEFPFVTVPTDSGENESPSVPAPTL